MTIIRGAGRAFAILLVALAVMLPTAAHAVAPDRPLVARKPSIAFGERQIGGEYYGRTTITNKSKRPLRVLVYAGLPDDFGFGLMPGSTCPALDEGAILAARESCVAVVRFSPTEGFLNWPAIGEMFADSFDPVTGARVGHLLIPVTGTAVL
ncbi:exported hypothetical protein [metagenome]|uniref:Uncharacterized protein n=1 Tax=metagenome TaxID=256318 RepID=A0A2P2C9K7_9ZZZZ